MLRNQHLQSIHVACYRAHDPSSARAKELDQKNAAVRLADVLLAINQKKPAPSLLLLGAPEDLGFALGNEIYKWNLRKDDLTEQSDEAIKFLADLLTN